jgi:hypothetical protein
MDFTGKVGSRLCDRRWVVRRIGFAAQFYKNLQIHHFCKIDECYSFI